MTVEDYLDSLKPSRQFRDDWDREAWGAVARIERAGGFLARATAEALAPLKLNRIDMFTLSFLRMAPNRALTHTEIADATFSSTSTTTGRVDRLEARGYVQRVADPSDRRSIRVQLTDLGDEILTQASELTHEAYNRLLSTASEADLRAVNDALRTLLIAAERQEDAVETGELEEEISAR